MNTGQMLLVILALALLATVTITINKMIEYRTSSMLETEADLNAISLGQTMLDEIMTKAYDDSVENPSHMIYDSTRFVPYAYFGPKGSEATNVPQPDTLRMPLPGQTPNIDTLYKSAKWYHDVSDYQFYRRLAFTPSMAIFSIIDTVYYVQETAPDVKSAHQTFFKKVVVSVRHPNMYPPGVNYDQWAGPICVQLSDVMVYRKYF